MAPEQPENVLDSRENMPKRLGKHGLRQKSDDLGLIDGKVPGWTGPGPGLSVCFGHPYRAPGSRTVPTRKKPRKGGKIHGASPYLAFRLCPQDQYVWQWLQLWHAHRIGCEPHEVPDSIIIRDAIHRAHRTIKMTDKKKRQAERRAGTVPTTTDRRKPLFLG